MNGPPPKPQRKWSIYNFVLNELWPWLKANRVDVGDGLRITQTYNGKVINTDHPFKVTLAGGALADVAEGNVYFNDDRFDNNPRGVESLSATGLTATGAAGWKSIHAKIPMETSLTSQFLSSDGKYEVSTFKLIYDTSTGFTIEIADDLPDDTARLHTSASSGSYRYKEIAQVYFDGTNLTSVDQKLDSHIWLIEDGVAYVAI